jgi:DNA-binding NarL/FixJ family response regulator
VAQAAALERAAPARVLIVDDHAPTRDHVSRVLQRHFTVVGSVPDADAFITQSPVSKPDAVVLDISLSNDTGFSAISRARLQGCTAAVIFLSVHEAPDVVRAAWMAGGLGYVAKRDLNSELVPAIKAALRGEWYVSSSIPMH